MCDVVTRCESCGYAKFTARRVQNENKKALSMLFYPAFFKEVEEAKLAMCPFALCGTDTLPAVMVHVKPMEGVCAL